MNSTVTLQCRINLSSKDPSHTVTVKSEFMTKCPDPEKYSIHELHEKFFMYSHLHNPNGPAVVRHDGGPACNGPEEYWLDGKCLSKENPELAAKIAHNAKFAEKLETTLES